MSVCVACSGSMKTKLEIYISRKELELSTISIWSCHNGVCVCVAVLSAEHLITIHLLTDNLINWNFYLAMHELFMSDKLGVVAFFLFQLLRLKFYQQRCTTDAKTLPQFLLSLFWCSVIFWAAAFQLGRFNLINSNFLMLHFKRIHLVAASLTVKSI